MLTFEKKDATGPLVGELKNRRADNFAKFAEPDNYVLTNLSRDVALSRVKSYVEQMDVTFFNLLPILSLIEAKGWCWPSYPWFSEYIEGGVGLRHATVKGWLKTFERLYYSGIRPETMFAIGWVKAKEIAKVVTKDNAGEWVTIAQEQNTRMLIDTVRKHLAKKATDDPYPPRTR
jgi:hypothetical protein